MIRYREIRSSNSSTVALQPVNQLVFVNKFVGMLGLTLTMLLLGCDPKPTKEPTKPNGSSTSVDDQPNQNGATGQASTAGNTRSGKPMSDSELISAIAKLGEKCNSKAFSDKESFTAVLRYEWQKIELDVSKLYHEQFPDRPLPSGTFLRPNVFYSHNKHYEWLVAEALVGEQRLHCEFGRTMMTSPYNPNQLKQEFLNKGLPDYDKLGAVIKQVFEQQNLIADQPTVEDETCVVNSAWMPLQSIGGVEYQQRTQHTVYETSGLTIFPARYFKSDNSRLQFATSMGVREKSRGGEGDLLGPLACSLFATDDQQIPLDTDSNNWAIFESEKLDANQMSQWKDTFESKPDMTFQRKIASSWKEDKNQAAPIKSLQDAIKERLK